MAPGLCPRTVHWLLEDAGIVIHSVSEEPSSRRFAVVLAESADAVALEHALGVLDAHPQVRAAHAHGRESRTITVHVAPG
jgi:hypothetical protein